MYNYKRSIIRFPVCIKRLFNYRRESLLSNLPFFSFRFFTSRTALNFAIYHSKNLKKENIYAKLLLIFDQVMQSYKHQRAEANGFGRRL